MSIYKRIAIFILAIIVVFVTIQVLSLLPIVVNNSIFMFLGGWQLGNLVFAIFNKVWPELSN